MDAGSFEGRSLGGDDGVSALERDIQAKFDESTITYQNDWAANAVGGYTFADYDHDGWYDYLEMTNERGSFIYCGNDIWRSL
jgi:hypothetical protein